MAKNGNRRSRNPLNLLGCKSVTNKKHSRKQRDPGWNLKTVPHIEVRKNSTKTPKLINPGWLLVTIISLIAVVGFGIMNYKEKNAHNARVLAAKIESQRAISRQRTSKKMQSSLRKNDSRVKNKGSDRKFKKLD